MIHKELASKRPLIRPTAVFGKIPTTMISARDNRCTIVAIASSTAPAVRGIVRIAGDEALQVLSAMMPAAQSGANYQAQHAALAALRRPSRIDLTLNLGDPLGMIDVVALVWPTAKSYTGLPSVEIHTFGSAPLLESIVQAATRCGARPAGPGEFTMRAFLAGRLDLPQAEAVLGVIDATSRDQLDAALTQLAGNVSAPLKRVRGDLLDLLADIEAGLDFVEEDISFIDDAAIRRRLTAAGEVVQRTRQQMATRHRSTAAVDIVLRGAPNAGKSSLLNALAGRSVALVSDVAGTTRDVVWVETSINGQPVRILDTAGVEDVDDEISRQSQQAASDSQRTAMLALWCVDHRTIGENQTAEQTPLSTLSVDPIGTIHVATQCDRGHTSSEDAAKRLNSLRQCGWVTTSAATGAGLDDLRDRVAELLLQQSQSSELGVSATAIRCADSLRRSADALQSALAMLDDQTGHEWVAGEIRFALSGIAEVTGEIYTDDILDRVFSRFCIGK